MINKIHQDLREILYRFAQNKKLHIIDRSANTMVLASSDPSIFNSAERLFKKELGIDIANMEHNNITPIEKQKTFYFENKKTKYKCILDETHHLNNKYTFVLMLTVSFLPN